MKNLRNLGFASALASVAALGAVCPAQAQGKTITLCWAAWDPANALCSGESPYPGGYALLPKDRIAHVHVKDCHMDGHKPVWGPVGTRQVDWKGQIAALHADGYKGWLSLETHWPGPGNDKFLASTICGWNMRGLAAM